MGLLSVGLALLGVLLVPSASADAKMPQTVSFTSTPPSSAVAGASYEVSATSSAGLPVKLVASGPCSFTRPTPGEDETLDQELVQEEKQKEGERLHGSPATLYFIGAGTCTLGAGGPETSEYEESPTASQSIPVSKDPTEQITFISSAPSDATVGGTYHASVSLSAGIRVTFSTTTPSVCAVPLKPEAVVLLATGTCTIAVRQTGVSEAEPPEGEQSFAVSKNSQRVTFTSAPPSAAVAGESYEVSATSSSGAQARVSAYGEGCSFIKPPLEEDLGDVEGREHRKEPEEPESRRSPAVVYFNGSGSCVIGASAAANAEYEAAPELEQRFSVARDASDRISFTSSAPTDAVLGGSYEPAIVSSANVFISFWIATPAVCEPVWGVFPPPQPYAQLIFRATGTCTVNVRQAGVSGTEPPEAQQSFTVAAKPQTITFTSTPPNNAVTGGSYEVSAISSAGLEVLLDPGGTFELGAGGTCSFRKPTPVEGETLGPELVQEEERKEKAETPPPSPATIYFVHAGTCTIEAIGEETPEYEAAPRTSQSFAVGKDPSADITIVSIPPSGLTVGGIYHASVHFSAGIRVSFSTTTPSVCKINPEGVILLGAGTCTVAVRQAGVTEAEPPEAEQSFTVLPKPQTITLTSTPPSHAAAGGSFEASATSSSGLPVAITAAGCSFTPPVAGEIESLSLKAKDEAEEAARRAGEVEPLRIAPATIYFLKAGTCTINAQQLGNSEYAPAVGVSESVPVAKDPSEQISFVSSPPSAATVGATYEASVQLSAGVRVSFLTTTPTVCAVKPEGVLLLGAGTCTIAVRQEGVPEAEPPEAEQSFAVVKRAQAITFTSTPPSNAVAGGSYPVSATASSGERVTLLLSGGCSFFPPTAREERLRPEVFEKGTVIRFQPLEQRQSPATIYFTAAGRCTISAAASSDPEYEGAQASQSVSVAKNPSDRITFISTPPRRAHTGGSYDPVVRLSEHIGVSFFTTTPSTCRIARLRAYVRLVGVGRCTIAVRQKGVSKSEPPEAEQSFSVHGPEKSNKLATS